MEIGTDSSSKEPEYDFWDDLPEELKQGINDAKAELDNGQGIPHVEVWADVNKFLSERY